MVLCLTVHSFDTGEAAEGTSYLCTEHPNPEDLLLYLDGAQAGHIVLMKDVHLHV